MDLSSIAVGLIAGASIGYIAATLRHGARADQFEYDLYSLRESYDALYREYSRLTDRDERGRFKGNSK